jgi:hypothetical protein
MLCSVAPSVSRRAKAEKDSSTKTVARSDVAVIAKVVGIGIVATFVDIGTTFVDIGIGAMFVDISAMFVGIDIGAICGGGCERSIASIQPLSSCAGKVFAPFFSKILLPTPFYKKMLNGAKMD